MENLSNNEPNQPTPDSIPEFHLDAEAFTTAYKDLEPKLLGYGKSLSGSQSDAEDYLSGVVERTWKNRENLKSSSNLRAYLYNSVSNAHLDHRRQLNKITDVSDDDLLDIPDESPDRDPQAAIQYNALYEAFEEAVENLPDKQSKTARARLIEGLSPEESQELLGGNLPALSSQLYEAKQKLQRKLRHWK
jgi:RNA polymerase sigma-70 factor, ECF subfamily